MHTRVTGARALIAPSREVDIPTATATVSCVENPYLVLVGKSAKHSKPILPGGKIDQRDVRSTSMIQAALLCITRELNEEIGLTKVCMELLSISSDRERDVRHIQAGTLRGTLAESCVADLSPDTMVLGRYGVPDYLFVTRVARDTVKSSEELSDLFWVDCRTVSPDFFAAGHGKFVERYRAMLRGDLS